AASGHDTTTNRMFTVCRRIPKSPKRMINLTSFLLAALLLLPLASHYAAAASFNAHSTWAAVDSNTQYILFNRAPGQGMNQGVPETLGRIQFEEVLARFPNRPGSRIQTGVSYVF